MHTTMTKTAILLFILTFCTVILKGQEFHEDGSMKLTAASTNTKYGYEPNHKKSIKVGKIQNQRAYLSALRGPNGETVQFSRIGSCCEFKSKSGVFGMGLLDKYEVNYQGLDEPVILYLNGYDYDSPKAPAGFTFVTGNWTAHCLITRQSHSQRNLMIYGDEHCMWHLSFTWIRVPFRWLWLRSESRFKQPHALQTPAGLRATKTKKSYEKVYWQHYRLTPSKPNRARLQLVRRFWNGCSDQPNSVLFRTPRPRWESEGTNRQNIAVATQNVRWLWAFA